MPNVVAKKLAVDFERGGPEGDRTLTVVLTFTVGAASWKVTLPAMPQAELRELLTRLHLAIVADERMIALMDAQTNVKLDRKV